MRLLEGARSHFQHYQAYHRRLTEGIPNGHELHVLSDENHCHTSAMSESRVHEAQRRKLAVIRAQLRT